MGNAVTNPGRFIEKKVFGVRREKSIFVDHEHHYHVDTTAVERQRAEVKEMQRQLEEQRKQTEEMLRQLRLEEDARARENARFQAELDRMERESAAERAQHVQDMKKMEKGALESRLVQVNQHMHDLQNELMRCNNAHDEVKNLADLKAVQVHNERTKIAHFEFERNDPSVKNLVVLGMTGDGKSTLCNRLCGDRSEFGEEGPFVVSGGIDSETIVVEKQIYERGGVRISVVDTPGIADSASRDREHVNNVITYLRGSNGVNQFLLVKNLANPRFSGHYKQMLREFEHFLGEEFWGFVTVVLTCVDGHNRRKFRNVKREVIQQLGDDHPFTLNRELPVIGIGFESYEDELIEMVLAVPQERYVCEFLTSPVEDLEAELNALKDEVERTYQEVERAKHRLDSVETEKRDIEHRLAAS